MSISTHLEKHLSLDTNDLQEWNGNEPRVGGHVGAGSSLWVQQSAASIKHRRSDLSIKAECPLLGYCMLMQGKKKGPSGMAKMCSSSLVDFTSLYAHINKVKM